MSQPRGFKAIVGAFTWTCWHVDNFASLIYETFDPGMERPIISSRMAKISLRYIISCTVRWQGTWKLVHGCGESCRPEPKASWRHDSPQP